jgi:hypothetical protein
MSQMSKMSMYSCVAGGALIIVCFLFPGFLYLAVCWAAYCIDHICTFISSIRHFRALDTPVSARKLSGSVTARHLSRTLSSVLGLSILLILVSAILLPLGLWLMPWLAWNLAIACWFPELGVNTSALDQLLSLCTGMMAVVFTSYHTFEGEKGKRRFAGIKKRLNNLINDADGFNRGSIGRVITRVARLRRRARLTSDAEMEAFEPLGPSNQDDLDSDLEAFPEERFKTS